MEIKIINDIADEVHQNAREKGFHNPSEPLYTWFANQCNNLHGEISELWDSYRGGKFQELCDKAEKMKEMGLRPLTCVEEEYADIIIRALDQCRRLNVDIGNAIMIKHQYNKTRPFMHGKIN